MKTRSIFVFVFNYIKIATVISITEDLIEQFETFGSRWKKKNEIILHVWKYL